MKKVCFDKKIKEAKIVHCKKTSVLVTKYGIINLDDILYIGPLFHTSDDQVPYAHVIQLKGYMPMNIPKEHCEKILQDACDILEFKQGE